MPDTCGALRECWHLLFHLSTSEVNKVLVTIPAQLARKDHTLAVGEACILDQNFKPLAQTLFWLVPWPGPGLTEVLDSAHP